VNPIPMTSFGYLNKIKKLTKEANYIINCIRNIIFSSIKFKIKCTIPAEIMD
jgi:hypothetical protein